MSVIQSMANQYRSGQRRVSDTIQSRLATITQQDPTIRAFLSVHTDQALAQAATLDQWFKEGRELPLLAGIPLAIKDNIHVKNTPTTCASKLLQHFIAPYHATVTERLLNQHAIIMGKVNMDEFAMGSSTENSAFQITRNPVDPSRVPGGSSGGSAAAVAANMVVGSLGSDTGGSIRQPASFCGIVGFKPTYGRVSRYGLVAFASSLDQIGPLTRTVEDSAIMLDAICGHDPLDSTSSPRPTPSFFTQLNPDVSGLKVGVPRELISEHVMPEVRESVMAALDRLITQGVSWEFFSMPSLKAAVSTYYIIAPAEASSNLARFDGVRYGHRADGCATVKEMMQATRGDGFGDEVKRRIMIGTYCLSSGYYDAYYNKAQAVRRVIQQEFNTAFAQYDVIITPTSPTTAFSIGQHHHDPLSMYIADIATIPVNMAGLPALSIPCQPSDPLPVGLQLIAPAFEEQRLLNLGLAYQQVAGWATLLEVHNA